YSAANVRDSQLSLLLLSMQRLACTQATLALLLRKASSAARSWPGSGRSSASYTAVKLPRANGSAQFSAFGLVRGPVLGAIRTCTCGIGPSRAIAARVARSLR